MKFRLFYQGPLKANGTPSDKHLLRRCFHRQLKTLWTQPPLDDVAKHVNMDPSKGKSLGVNRGSYICVPLVCERERKGDANTLVQNRILKISDLE